MPWRNEIIIAKMPIIDFIGIYALMLALTLIVIASAIIWRTENLRVTALKKQLFFVEKIYVGILFFTLIETCILYNTKGLITILFAEYVDAIIAIPFVFPLFLGTCILANRVYKGKKP